MLSITNKLYNQVKASLQRGNGAQAAGDEEQGAAGHASQAGQQASQKAAKAGRPTADQRDPSPLRQIVIDPAPERSQPERLRAPTPRAPSPSPSFRAWFPQEAPSSEEV